MHGINCKILFIHIKNNMSADIEQNAPLDESLEAMRTELL